MHSNVSLKAGRLEGKPVILKPIGTNLTRPGLFVKRQSFFAQIPWQRSICFISGLIFSRPQLLKKSFCDYRALRRPMSRANQGKNPGKRPGPGPGPHPLIGRAKPPVMQRSINIDRQPGAGYKKNDFLFLIIKPSQMEASPPGSGFFPPSFFYEIQDSHDPPGWPARHAAQVFQRP